MKCENLNKSVMIIEDAKDEFKKLYQEIDQEVVQLDTHSLLLPGTCLFRSNLISFDFGPEYKWKLYAKYNPDAKSGYHGLNHMNREELEDFAIDKELDIETSDYEDEPLENLVDAIKEEAGLFNFKDDRDADELECKFDHIGLYVWKPENAQSGKISIYIEIEGDDSNWSLIKKTANHLNGEIFLHHDEWEFNEIICRSFSLADDLEPKTIAGEVVKVAEKIMVLPEED